MSKIKENIEINRQWHYVILDVIMMLVVDVDKVETVIINVLVVINGIFDVVVDVSYSS